MVTQKEIAKKCGVSVSAVSAAFRRPGEVSEETREKILEVASRLGYNAKSSLFQTIGLFIEDFSNHYNVFFYNEILGGILQQACLTGQKIQLLEKVPDNYEIYTEINGLLILGRTSEQSLKMIQEADKRKIPHVLCGCPTLPYKWPRVYFNNVPGVANLMEYVLNCNHRHIAQVNGETCADDLAWNNFLNTVNGALGKRDLPPVSRHQISYGDIQTVEIAVNQILNTKPAITCIVCSNDFIAYHVYRCLHKYKINIPEDISVTGFDDMVIPDYLIVPGPGLTTVYCNRRDMGIRAVNYLNALLRGQSAGKELGLDTKLVVRGSVKRL